MTTSAATHKLDKVRTFLSSHKEKIKAYLTHSSAQSVQPHSVLNTHILAIKLGLHHFLYTLRIPASMDRPSETCILDSSPTSSQSGFCLHHFPDNPACMNRQSATHILSSSYHFPRAGSV